MGFKVLGHSQTQVLLCEVSSIEAGKVLVAKREIKDLRFGLGRGYGFRFPETPKTLLSKATFGAAMQPSRTEAIFQCLGSLNVGPRSAADLC